MKENILIIEDNYMMRLFLYNYLCNDFNVYAYETLDDGLKELRYMEKPDAILTNYKNLNTEKPDDLNDLNELKRNLHLKDVPLFILTDSDTSDQRIEALTIGASDCMSKPFNPVELKIRIRRLINTEGTAFTRISSYKAG